MAKADKYYFFSKKYFYDIILKLKGRIYILNIIDQKGQIVGSSIFFHNDIYFHYHLSGRTELANNSVNNFLLDEAVKFAKKIGTKVFHFGGGRSNKSDDSLLKFKSNFSSMRLPFHIGKKIHNQRVYDDVVKQWEFKYPEKAVKYKNLLLKYRY